MLLAGHGSSRPGSDNPTRIHTEALKRKSLFADVFEGYIKQAPYLDDVLSRIATDDLYVVPMLTGHGYITDELIPGALIKAANAKSIHMCEPIGCHPDIAELLARQVSSIIDDNALPSNNVSAILVAHGNRINPRNASQAKALAKVISKKTNGVRLRAAFIEEAPLISDWQAEAETENVIILPFLIGGGLHGAEDVPNMVGIDPQTPALEALGGDIPVAGPFPVQEHRIWYCRAFGHDPALVNMIVDLVERAP